MKIDSLLKKTKDERHRYITLLVDEITEKRLAVFVGAGCAMSLGLPSWVDLIDGLLEKYNIKTRERDVFRLASRLERELGPLKFREKIIERLRVNEIGKSDLHDALVNLDTNLFITTNYDTLLEDYFKLKRISPSLIVDPKDIPSIAPTRKTIVKLHGDLNSPSSLIITAADYTRYKSEDKAFIHWLNSVAAQRSILFVGAGFDDPRLKDVDDYVLNIFGSRRRQPFIFFKIPTQSQGKSDEDFAIEIEDFQARCDEFRDRGFYLILVENYEKIAGFLSEVNDRVLQEKIKADPGNLEHQLKIQTDYSGKLEKSLEHLIDKRIQELVNKILIPPPGIKKIKEGMEELSEFLNTPPHRLGPESKLQGFLCMTEAFLIIANTKADIIAARRYYDSANEVFQELHDKSKFQERLIRLRAKLLFEEGETDEAINSLSKSTDPRTVSFWLLYLTEAKRYDEAYDFIEKNEVSVQWVSEALRIYIIKGKIPEAERLFRESLQGFEAASEKGNIADTEYKDDFFFDRICFVMIYAIYFKALEFSGIRGKQGINFANLSDDTRRWLEKSLEFIDLFFEKGRPTNPADDYRVIQILSTKMNICRFLFKFERADEAAKKLTMIDPIERSVVEYIINRGKLFGRELFLDPIDTFQRISKKLAEKDFQDQAWAWWAIAHIEMILGNIEKSFEAVKKTIPLIKENEKSEILKILDVGRALVKLDEIFILIKSSIRFTEEENRFWEGVIKWLPGDIKEAFEKISKIDIVNYPEDLKALIPNIKGQLAIENQNWEEARKFLEEALKLYPNPLTMESLLFVLTKLQDAVEVLRLAEKLEYYGTKNDQITFIKAQALRNLRQFEKSAELLLELNKNSPGNPQYAFVLARVLSFLDKEAEAKQVLTPFLQPGEKFDMNCLKLAVDIHFTLNESEDAFRILDNCWDEIREQPDLVMKHLELAFKAGKEKEAGKSLKRLEELNEEGRITDMVFLKSDNLEDIINLTKKRQETVEKANERYMAGELPRITLSEIFGNTLYLDWAIRTQPLPEDFFTAKGDAEFTIYSTNGFKLIRKDKIIRFAAIEAPKEAKEIVIDYHALITLHRLGFIGKLCKCYDKIYYPDVFKRLWKMEQTRYTPFQLSRVKVYKKLAERLDKHEIKKSQT